MIAALSGKVKSIAGFEVVVDVNGVGYLINCTKQAAINLDLDQAADLIIHTDVQEQSIKLYAFVDQTELRVFKLLIGVNKIGAKTASEILSAIDKTDLLRLLASSDLNGLKKIKGIGAKTAERLVVELRDKVKDLVNETRLTRSSSESDSPQLEDALAALQALGFSRKQSDVALAGIEVNAKSDTSDLVREALARI